MGLVILGSIIGAVVGLCVGWLPIFSGPWSHAAAMLGQAQMLHSLSMMIGTATGAIVGAIAGRAAADPNSVRLPGPAVKVLVALAVVCVLLGAFAVWTYFVAEIPPAAPPAGQVIIETELESGASRFEPSAKRQARACQFALPRTA